MEEAVSRLGIGIALLGIVSSLLKIIQLNLKILVWIDAWGSGIGWGIRLGLIGLGILLFLIAPKLD